MVAQTRIENTVPSRAVLVLPPLTAHNPTITPVELALILRDMYFSIRVDVPKELGWEGRHGVVLVGYGGEGAAKLQSYEIRTTWSGL